MASSHHQRRRRAEIHTNIEKRVSDPMLSIGLAVDSVQIRDMDTDNSFRISLLPDCATSAAGEQNEGQHIPQISYLLLKYGVSMQFYHELSMECDELPRSYLVIMTVICIVLQYS